MSGSILNLSNKINNRSDCELWIRSYWTKYFTVYPSFQTVQVGTQEIMINGENFASSIDLIKVKCMDSHNRILQCSIIWVDSLSGKQAKIYFNKPFEDKNTGKIYARLDSDNLGWCKPVLIAIVTKDINPYISMTILMSFFLFGLIPAAIFCIIWRYNQRKYKRTVRAKLADKRALKRSQITTQQALEYELPGLH